MNDYNDVVLLIDACHILLSIIIVHFIALNCGLNRALIR